MMTNEATSVRSDDIATATVGASSEPLHQPAEGPVVPGAAGDVDASPRVTRLEGFDGDALAHVLQGSTVRHAQLAAGRFNARIYRVALEESMVESGTYNLPVHGQGHFPTDRVLLGTLLSNTGPAWISEEPFGRGDIVFCGPGAPLDVVLGHDAHWVAFGMPLSRLVEEAVQRDIRLPDRLDRVIVSRVSRESFGQLDAATRDVLDLVGDEPAALDDPTVRSGVERTVLHAYLKGLGSVQAEMEAGPSAGAARRAAAARRTQVVRRVEEYIESRPGAPIYLSELCAVTEVSERTLRYVFEWRFGMSPIAYLRARRLCGVRRDLLRARGADIVVKDVARRWGYWHCGRLAAEYRTQFGESPSETVGRPGRGRAGQGQSGEPRTST